VIFTSDATKIAFQHSNLRGETFFEPPSNLHDVTVGTWPLAVIKCSPNTAHEHLTRPTVS